MRIKLTKTAIAALTPRPKPYHVFDSEMRGLVLRVQPTGQRTFYFDYRRADGRRTRLKLGVFGNVSPEGARSLATKAAGQVAHGVDVSAERKRIKIEAQRARASTLKVFLEGRYSEWASQNLRSGAIQVKRMQSDFRDWLEKPMSALNPWLIEGYRKKRQQAKRSPKTINREIQRLRAAVGRAVVWGLLDVHPFASIKPLKQDKGGRVRYLSAEEEKALRDALQTREGELRAARDRFNAWRAARHLKLLPQRRDSYVDHLQPMVLIAMNTGLRRGELLSLRWGEVNLEGKILTVRGGTAKTGQTRHVPLNTEAVTVLSAWQKLAESTGAAAYVFPGADGVRMGNINRSWDRAVTLAKLADFRFHDLRHHFASQLVMRGVPLNTVRELLGHTSLEMTVRYSHLAPEGLASAVESLRKPRHEPGAPTAVAPSDEWETVTMRLRAELDAIFENDRKGRRRKLDEIAAHYQKRYPKRAPVINLAR